MSIVLGIDPGLANLGVSLLDITENEEKVIFMGVFSTQKSDKKLTVLASDDNLRRCRELAKELNSIISEYRPKVICVEAKSFPRNASAAAKTSMSWGIIGTLSQLLGIPVVQASPQAVKKKLVGKNSASKEEIQEYINNKFGLNMLKSVGVNSIKNDKLEHAYDSCAVVLACLDGELIRLLRNI